MELILTAGITAVGVYLFFLLVCVGLRVLAGFRVLDLERKTISQYNALELRVGHIEAKHNDIADFQDTEVRKLRAREAKRKEKEKADKLEALAEARLLEQNREVEPPPPTVPVSDNGPQADPDYVALCRRANLGRRP